VNTKLGQPTKQRLIRPVVPVEEITEFPFIYIVVITISSEVCKCFLSYSIRTEHSRHSGEEEYMKEDFKCFEIINMFSPDGTIVRQQSGVDHAGIVNTVWMG
jgi:hypothetical protein